MKVFALLIVLCLLSGCGAFFGNLRQDLDDLEADNSPVTGGRWTERGILAREYGDRAPAGLSDGGRYSQLDDQAGPQGRARYNDNRSWVNGEQVDANRRDLNRYGGAEAEDGQRAVISSGAVPDMEPAMRRQYKNGMRATRADFVDETQNEGSLWGSDGQTNYYFTKNKVRGVGDIVTLNVEADLVRDVGLEIRRNLSTKEKERELELAAIRKSTGDTGAADDKSKAGSDKVATSAAAPVPAGTERSPAATAAAGAPSKEEKPPTLADVDVSRSLGLKAADTMMGEVIERYPNGNYKIRATKRVAYSNGASRLVNLIAVVKGTDISEDDVVASGKLYEYRIEANR